MRTGRRRMCLMITSFVLIAIEGRVCVLRPNGIRRRRRFSGNRQKWIFDLQRLLAQYEWSRPYERCKRAVRTLRRTRARSPGLASFVLTT